MIYIYNELRPYTTGHSMVEDVAKLRKKITRVYISQGELQLALFTIDFNLFFSW